MNPAYTRIRRIEAAPEITSPTDLDVINGRGQGIQRHPGNMKYRTLVYLNKGLYAKCPRPDKSKISKGIVAAIRQVGGRFLEFDEASGVYNDIGDKKAYEKTSQALREGQSKTRKQIDEEKDPNSRVARLLQNQQRVLSSEGYFGYELQLLLSLHRPDNLSAAGSSANHQQFAPSPASEVVNLTAQAYSPYITPSPTANRQIFNRQIFPSDNVAARSSSDPYKVSLQSSHGSADNNESWRSSISSFIETSSFLNTSFNSSASNVYNSAYICPSIGPSGTIIEQQPVASGPLSRPGRTGEITSERKPSASNPHRPNLRDYKIEDWDSTRTLQTSNLSSQTDATKYQICPSRATNHQMMPSSESEVAERAKEV